ncbi:MAG: Slp family lipoprotein [Methylococcales symbiont of Hymedesmia sp. n. MRB-2018]|nr:MAG: Slp family lipoprotein [Methylococcales symbiont of Hymedesmia sp. n. MRB-2018]
MKSLIIVSLLFLQACSNLPANIKNAPQVDTQLHHVLANSHNFKNTPVRWGGKIIDVENKVEGTQIQILYYPLNHYGRPLLDKPSLGRFISISKQFLDPAIYPKDTEITIAGSINGMVEKVIGEQTIKVPVVTIDGHHIWPKYQQIYRPYYDYYNHNHYYGYRTPYVLF